MSETDSPRSKALFARSEVSPLTVNRLSVYLRCLRMLQEQGARQVSSQELGRYYGLSPALFRKDLAQLGEMGIRGVGYDVDRLADNLSRHLGLDTSHRMVLVGAGNLGRALARYFGAGNGPFRVVAVLDNDAAKIGTPLAGLTIRPYHDLAVTIEETGAQIGLLTVPAAAAQAVYDQLVAAGVGSILNFAPVHLRRSDKVHTRTVDLRIHLEELAFFSGR